MTGAFKTAVLLAALVGVVGGLTYLSLNSPTPPESPDKPGAKAAAGKPPLQFFTSTARWDPSSRAPCERYFSGYVETTKDGYAYFWFENPNPAPVTFRPAGTSCGSCSDGAVAVVPVEPPPPAPPPAPVGDGPPAPPSRLVPLALASQSAAPPGPFGPFAAAAAAGRLYETLPWQAFSFSDTDAAFTIPAAPPGGTQLGILKLHYRAGSEPGPKNLATTFTAQTAGSPAVQNHTIRIAVMMAAPFDLLRPEIDAGELTEGSGPRTYEVVAYSSVLDAAGFPPPTPGVRDGSNLPVVGEKFVTFGPPVPLADAELDALAFKLSTDAKQAVRVRSGYRLPVTVSRQAGADALDIGPLERKLWYTSNSFERAVALRGTVRGSVSLEGGAADLEKFNGTTGSRKKFKVVLDDPATELSVVEPATVPDFLAAALKRLPAEGDRGYYELTVEVPAGALFGPLPPNSVVVLQAKGAKTQRVRIPVKGFGRLGA